MKKPTRKPPNATYTPSNHFGSIRRHIIIICVFLCLIITNCDAAQGYEHVTAADIPKLVQHIQYLESVVYSVANTSVITPIDLAKNCTSDCSAYCADCQEELCAAPPVSWTDPMIYLKLAGTVVLVLMSGFCAGETTSLFSVDLNTLGIIAKSDPNPKNRTYAKRIIPVRSNGNLLLCTLIMTNVCVNAALSLISAELTSGLVGFFLSSALIVVFGEIIPQAVCVRYTLFIGASTVWVIYTFMFVLFPVAYPLSAILNMFLEQEMGQYYDIGGLKHLIDLHAESRDKTGLELDAANIVHGALEFATKKVADVMTPAKNVYCVDVAWRLDAHLMNDIWSHGHSRVPVYKGNKDNVVSILHVKDICVLNADDELPLSTVSLFYGKEPLFVDPQLELREVLQFFKAARTHMAIVQEPTVEVEGRDPIYKTVGVITFEDVIEEILREEIVDESDRYVSNLQEERVGGTRLNPILDFRLGLDYLTKRLTPNQVQSACQFLQRSSRYFQMFPPDNLKQLLGKSRIVVMKPREKEEIFLYKKGEPVEFCTLVITGRLEVVASHEDFITYLGPWSLIGVRGLTQESYVSDFSAKVIEDSTVLRIFRSDFIAEVQDLMQNDEYFYLPDELNWIKGGNDEVDPVDDKDIHFVIKDDAKRIPKRFPAPTDPSTATDNRNVRKRANSSSRNPISGFILPPLSAAKRSITTRGMRRSRSALSHLKSSTSEDGSPPSPTIIDDQELILGDDIVTLQSSSADYIQFPEPEHLTRPSSAPSGRKTEEEGSVTEKTPTSTPEKQTAPVDKPDIVVTREDSPETEFAPPPSDEKQ